MYKISFVIPCLNEEKTLPIVLQKCNDSIKRLNLNAEIVVSDNGSTDKSVSIAQSYGARVVHCPKRGYGNALTCAMENANGEYLIMGDADDSYNFHEIDDFIKYLDEGHDVVTGTRLKGKIEKQAMPFLHQYVGTPVLTFLLNQFFKTKISDCNCGMKGIRRDAFKKMNLISEGMEFVSEISMKSGLLKLKIKEIPITLYKDKRDRKPHLHTWRDGWRNLRLLMLFAPNYTFLIPGLIMFAFGLLIVLPLTFFNVSLFEHRLNYHFSLLGSLISIIGFQTINIGVFAKIYSSSNNLTPVDSFLTKFQQIFTLEKGIITGIIFFILGLVINIYILAKWIQIDFGQFNEVKLVALASTLLIVGIQIIFSSFFINIMKIKSR